MAINPSGSEPMISGTVAPGFEPVAEAFQRNFDLGREHGAACAVTVGGELVVDLWGGVAAPGRAWEYDTLVNVFSTTKGVSSIAVAHAHSRGLLDFDQPVADIWPEFAAEGKGAITIRQLLSHQAGLCAIDAHLDLGVLADPDQVATAIAAQKPAWTPGQLHGYHGISLGWYESELIRRVDPERRTIGQYFADEIATPLGLDFHIGLPDDIPDERIARLHAPAYAARMVLNIRKLPPAFVRGFLTPGSLTARTFSNPRVLGQPARYNDRSMLRIELPASNGVGTARSIAAVYGDLAIGSPILGIGDSTLVNLREPAQDPSNGLFDQVLKQQTRFSLGVCKPWPGFEFGSPTAFGTPGAGGSFGFADPELGMGFAYVMNRMDYYLLSDPRELAVREAAQKCARAHSARR
ncbi:MAG: serine hydrolase domain-containing protein [Actinomycetales bacterium]